MTFVNATASPAAPSGNPIAAAARAVVDFARNVHVARKTRIQLSRLEDHILRDIGVQPFEIKQPDMHTETVRFLMSLR